MEQDISLPKVRNGTVLHTETDDALDEEIRTSYSEVKCAILYDMRDVYFKKKKKETFRKTKGCVVFKKFWLQDVTTLV